jgi:hypothetical protein
MLWQANSLHCVMFSQSQGGAADALQPWLRMFGVNPQSYQQATPADGPTAQASGPLGIYTATLQMQPGRLDLVLQPGTTQVIAGSVPAIQEIPPALGILREYAGKMIGPDGPSPVRIAVISNLLKPMPDATAARIDFLTSTRLDHIPAAATELQLAINIPMRLKSAECEMNRLCRWSTAKVQLFQFQIGNLPFMSPLASPAEQKELSTLQIDLNTTPRVDPFELSAVPSILDEMITEAKALICGGYDRLADRG